MGRLPLHLTSAAITSSTAVRRRRRRRLLPLSLLSSLPLGLLHTAAVSAARTAMHRHHRTQPQLPPSSPDLPLVQVSRHHGGCCRLAQPHPPSPSPPNALLPPLRMHKRRPRHLLHAVTTPPASLPTLCYY